MHTAKSDDCKLQQHMNELLLNLRENEFMTHPQEASNNGFTFAATPRESEDALARPCAFRQRASDSS